MIKKLVLMAVLMAASFATYAMQLTAAQSATLKAFIQADPVLLAMVTAQDWISLQDHFNEDADPTYIVWNPRVDPNTFLENGMVWADWKNASAGQVAILNTMMIKGYINAEKPNERLGLEEAFGKNSATNAGIQPHLKRPASRIETLFALGAGTTEAPGTMALRGAITHGDLSTVMAESE